MKNAEGIRELSFQFALELISTIKEFRLEEKEFIITNQLMKSGTAVGALIREAEFAQSKLDFISKMSIALKEANESVYWLEIMINSYKKYKDAYEVLLKKAMAVLRILASIVKKSKENLLKSEKLKVKG